MNLYFLLEGKRTEFQIYPEWLRHLVPELSRVYNPADAEQNNYYMISGMGYPSLLNFLQTSALEVNEIGKYDYLVICVDAEEERIPHRVWEIWNFIEKNDIKPGCKLKIIVQNRCIESWFLGNRQIFEKKPKNKFLKKFIKFYNVFYQDPEVMPKYQGFNTTAVFHYEYLKLLMKEKNLNYSKKNTKYAEQKKFLDELILRTQVNTEHLKSFRFFLDFIAEIKEKINY